VKPGQRRRLERLEADRDGPPLTTAQATARLREDALVLIRETDEQRRERVAAEEEERLVAIVRSGVFAPPPRCYRDHGEDEPCERCRQWAARAVRVLVSRLNENHWGRDVRAYFERRGWPIPTEMRTRLEEHEAARQREAEAAKAEGLRLLRPLPE
jgi:hypothetical protein